MSKQMKIRVEGKKCELFYWQIAISENKEIIPAHWESVGIMEFGEQYHMGLGKIYIEDAGTHARLFRLSSTGNLNFYQDLTPDGNWIISPHSAYRQEDIDPDKAEIEPWHPWETHQDYINKIRRQHRTAP